MAALSFRTQAAEIDLRGGETPWPALQLRACQAQAQTLALLARKLADACADDGDDTALRLNVRLHAQLLPSERPGKWPASDCGTPIPPTAQQPLDAAFRNLTLGGRGGLCAASRHAFDTWGAAGSAVGGRGSGAGGEVSFVALAAASFPNPNPNLSPYPNLCPYCTGELFGADRGACNGRHSERTRSGGEHGGGNTLTRPVHGKGLGHARALGASGFLERGGGTSGDE
ncbi:hypothetical protein T492DRAFT_841769 [Pavlovales sp. CCMP2436]|nr:hypothetical protein T492DRAFT_841769 [Pavlovales sp. CCMP2436]